MCGSIKSPGGHYHSQTDMRSRICSSSDIIAMTALPTSHAHDPRRGADVFSKHARVLFAWADQAALGVTQRVHKARIVTHEAALDAELRADSIDWYTWANTTASSEGEAVALQRTIEAYNAAVQAWAHAVFALRVEQWHAETEERRAREESAQARIVQRATARDTIAGTLTTQLAVDDAEKSALLAHWARIAAAIEARAAGIASTDGRTERRYNTLQAEAISAAAKLGAQLDAASRQAS